MDFYIVILMRQTAELQYHIIDTSIVIIQPYRIFSLVVSNELASLFHSVVIPFSFMKCNDISTNVMSTEGASQKAVRPALVLLLCQMQYALLFLKIMRCLILPSSQWSDTSRHQRWHFTVVAVPNITKFSSLLTTSKMQDTYIYRHS